jgi:AraC-like DNA-binding protein
VSDAGYGDLQRLKCFMNPAADQFAEHDALPDASTTQSPPSHVTMMRLANLSDYQPLKMARICRISLRHLQRECKIEFGCTPREWLKIQRLNNALIMLCGAPSVKYVAYALAYHQIPQFCREFKTRFGITPSNFRHSHLLKQAGILAAHLELRKDGERGELIRRPAGGGRLLARIASFR